MLHCTHPLQVQAFRLLARQQPIAAVARVFCSRNRRVVIFSISRLSIRVDADNDGALIL
jgi:hypothetical protein